MVIGKRLQKRRKELNLSRAQLAEMVHVTASAIANYENSISYPKPDILISLILALKIDANYLFEEHDGLPFQHGKRLCRSSWQCQYTMQTFSHLHNMDPCRIFQLHHIYTKIPLHLPELQHLVVHQ